MRVDSRFRSEWLAQNPVLASGILGLDRADNSVKVGDGVHHWIDLPYQSGQSAPVNAVPANSPYVTKDELQALLGTSGGSSGGSGTVNGVSTETFTAAINLLQDKATAATDQELAAAIATVNSVVAGKQSSATAATDAELAAAVATINDALSTKQDASLAATDAEVAAAVANVNTLLTGKADLTVEQADKAALQSLISANTSAISANASAIALKQDANTAATDSELTAGLASVASPVIASQALTASYTVTNAFATIPNWQVQVPANSGEVEVTVPEGLLINISTGTNAAGTKFALEFKIVDEAGATVGYNQKAIYSSAATAQGWVDTLPLGKVVPNNAAIKTYSVQARMTLVGTNGALATLFTAQSGFTNPTLRARR